MTKLLMTLQQPNEDNVYRDGDSRDVDKRSQGLKQRSYSLKQTDRNRETANRTDCETVIRPLRRTTTADLFDGRREQHTRNEYLTVSHERNV